MLSSLTGTSTLDSSVSGKVRKPLLTKHNLLSLQDGSRAMPRPARTTPAPEPTKPGCDSAVLTAPALHLARVHEERAAQPLLLAKNTHSIPRRILIMRFLSTYSRDVPTASSCLKYLPSTSPRATTYWTPPGWGVTDALTSHGRQHLNPNASLYRNTNAVLLPVFLTNF